jgi:hypothetical protein
MYSSPFKQFLKSQPRSQYQTYTKEIEFKLEMFKQFPADCCQLVFNDYIHLYTTPQESVYITIITSILEGKTDPNDIFRRRLRCDYGIAVNGHCKSGTIPCCYQYPYQEILLSRILPPVNHTCQRMTINFHDFQYYNLDNLMKILVKDKL